MDMFGFEVPDFEGDFRRNIVFLAATVVLVGGLVTGNNVFTDGDARTEVGPVHVFTVCEGLEVADFCLGVEMKDHDPTGYDTWNGTVEEGTERYYNRVESELMLQAYNICEDDSLEGMEWLGQAEFDNRTGEEWSDVDEVDLWGCEDAFRFQVDE